MPKDIFPNLGDLISTLLKIREAGMIGAGGKEKQQKSISRPLTNIDLDFLRSGGVGNAGVGAGVIGAYIYHY